MYILVEILHTEFQYISLIEMQKYNWNRKKIEKRETEKNGPFVPVGNTNRDKRVRQTRDADSLFCPGWWVLFVLVARPGYPKKKKFPNRDSNDVL